jgi:aspartyl/asparaginyl beta-hydroxylase (cupin superfamily)
MLLQEAVAADGTRITLWAKLSAMRRITGDLPGALNAIDRALGLDAFDFSALLGRAFLLEQMGDARSGEAFAIAVAQAPDRETLPPALASALGYAEETAARHQSETEDRIRKSIQVELEATERDRVSRFVSNAVRRTRHYHQEPTHFHYPGLPEVEFHESSGFPGLHSLEEQWLVIRREFNSLIAAQQAEMVPYIQYDDKIPLRQWRDLNKSQDWTAIHLLRNGQRVEANARHCPATLGALSALGQPHIRGASPNAMFSLLAPRTRIPPHTGVANTRLVAHLPLIVPPFCGFRVGATTREWREGGAFVFDDTIEHEAWNDSDQLRVVLIFDLWPPALSAAERAAVAQAIPAAGVGFSGVL